jgi:hypothetical protein
VDSVSVSGGGGGDVGLDGLVVRGSVFNPQCLRRSQHAGATCMCLILTITITSESEGTVDK